MVVPADALWLPVAFLVMMGLSVLAYVCLDGFDLGVGVLLGLAEPAQRDTMVASIGPFWDANETWLVLGVGILLVAFPAAHGLVLSTLYLPVALMLAGLILRGVAFDFRAKAGAVNKPWWDGAFIGGSLLASLAQGYMLGAYVIGFEAGLAGVGFGLLVALCLTAAYAFVGACWLVMKTEDSLQRRAVRWAQRALWLTVLGVAAISLATPVVSEHVFARWFRLPEILLLAPVPLLTAALLGAAWFTLGRLPLPGDRFAWLPFVCATAVFALCFLGLAYSFYPYVVPERLTAWEAASAPESLWVIFLGAAVVLPVIVAYNVFVYRVFRGKTRGLSYE